MENELSTKPKTPLWHAGKSIHKEGGVIVSGHEAGLAKDCKECRHISEVMERVIETYVAAALAEYLQKEPLQVVQAA